MGSLVWSIEDSLINSIPISSQIHVIVVFQNESLDSKGTVAIQNCAKLAYIFLLILPLMHSWDIRINYKTSKLPSFFICEVEYIHLFTSLEWIVTIIALNM